MEKWIGCTVSVDCGPLHGTYQGEVSKINTEQQILILKKAFLNGAPHPDGNVTIVWEMINDLSILKTAEENKETKPATSKIQVRKPVAKRMDRSVSENIVASRVMPKNCVMNRMAMPQSSSSHNLGELASKSVSVPIENSTIQNSYQASSSTPNKKDRPRQNRWIDRNEACFGEPVDNIMHKEFDFEKNLALFNKKAVYDEINAQKPDLVKQTDKPVNYRHNENVLESSPMRLRQISVPAACGKKEYVTDSGVVVPCITSDLRRAIFDFSEDYGYTFKRQCEIMGRASTELIIQLLGGARRLNPQNSHQKPLVVVMCGCNRAGAMGLNTARQLASHGVDTVVHLNREFLATHVVSQEFSLYHLTGQKSTTRVEDLPSGAVDLVVVALASDSSCQIDTSILSWIMECRAPLLSLDPPASGTPGIPVKLSVIPPLPLPHCENNGRLYMVNLAIPEKVYIQVGVNYKSPFGPKFVIPLHKN
ncbi:hypothetical protein LSTR_LSTR000173 [Laodelphax striatellus]|uniref:Enhancer of mRNA-decapping protein 3 n=1 Tax=Laodelphax striatellus TaxID=195883 RepID=A0A482X6E5_LAOST|nr:hypothetical protein LSTR_LSTR000173 [Laodelphax striatellus]